MYEVDVERIGAKESSGEKPDRPVYAIPDWADQFPPQWQVAGNTHRYTPEDLSAKYGEAVVEALNGYEDEIILDFGPANFSGVPAIAGEDNRVLQLDREREYLDTLEQYKDVVEEQYDVSIPGDSVQADGTKIPLPDNSVDVVFAGALCVPYEDTDIERVLKPGGDLVMATFAFHEHDLEEAIARDELEGLHDRFEDVSLEDAVLTWQNYDPA